jgi:hypothetical protein
MPISPGELAINVNIMHMKTITTIVNITRVATIIYYIHIYTMDFITISIVVLTIMVVAIIVLLFCIGLSVDIPVWVHGTMYGLLFLIIGFYDICFVEIKSLVHSFKKMDIGGIKNELSKIIKEATDTDLPLDDGDIRGSVYMR